MNRFDTASSRTTTIWPAALALAFSLTACAPDSSTADTQEAGSAEPPSAAAETDSPASAETDDPAPASAETDVPAPDVAASDEPAAPPADPFLAENAKREGVVTTATGLQYEVLASGDGATPGPTDTVTTHYHGTFTDGRVFDSSVERGVPASFPVNRVIKGWTEALQLMKVGDKWKLYCPPDLAYGEAGRSGIPPNSTLVFEVELLDVKPGG